MTMSYCGHYGFGDRLWPCEFDVRLLQYDLMSDCGPITLCHIVAIWIWCQAVAM